MPNVEIKDFNVLIDRKGSFDLPGKNEEEMTKMTTQLVISWILLISKNITN